MSSIDGKYIKFESLAAEGENRAVTPTTMHISCHIGSARGVDLVIEREMTA